MPPILNTGEVVVFRPATEKATSGDERPSRVGSRLRGLLGPIARSAISIGLIAGSILGFVALGQGRPTPTKAEVEVIKPLVETARVIQHEQGIDFDVDGVVIPFREIEVPAEVAGRVCFKSDNCRVGHTVAREELLLRIDPADYQLEIRRLEQELAQAGGSIEELRVEIAGTGRQIELAKEELVIKRRELRRYEQIDDPGVYSQTELDAARHNELAARNSLQSQKDQLRLQQSRITRLEAARELAQAQLDKAKLELARTEVRSPIDGVVTTDFVEQDCYVQRGGQVVTIQDTSCMEVRCSLQMKEMHWLWQASAETGTGLARRAYSFPETPVTVTYDLGASKCRWQGTLQYYDGGKVDEQTRMVPCRVRVCEPSRVTVENPSTSNGLTPVLMAGMFVTVRVHAKPNVSLLRLPEAAVQPGGTVWTVREGRLRELPLRVAHSTREQVLAYATGSEIGEGDLVVVSPLAAPTENAAVALVGESR